MAEKETPDETAAPEAPAEETGKEETQAEAPVADGGEAPEEDLRATITEMQSTLNDLADRTRKAEHDAMYYRTLVTGQEEKPPVEVQPQKPEVGEDFWKDPLGSIERVMDAREKRRAEADAKTQREQTARKYQENFASGSGTMKQNPALFKGIEGDVMDYVRNTAMSSNMPPDALNNPALWEAAAAMLRWEKGERDFSRYYSNAPKATKAAVTERPGPTAPPKPKRGLTDKEKAYAANWGLSEEQYLATKQTQEEET